MSTQFLQYDDDDGRSSKIFQNEEDESYYDELEKEFEKVDLTNKESVKTLRQKIETIFQSESQLQNLSASFSSELKDLESTLK